MVSKPQPVSNGMKIHRFFIDQKLEKGECVVSDKETVHQMRNVFRYKEGDTVVLLDGQENEAESKISHITSKEVTFQISEIAKNTTESEKKVTLYCALAKSDNFELIVEKATEIGITTIVPLLTERTVKTNIKLERASKIAKEASEQSGRGVIPHISEPIKLSIAFSELKNFDAVFLFDPTATELFTTPKANKIALFIGPEGGWSPEELKLAQEQGILLRTFGKLVYRVETAAIIASYKALE